MSDQLSLTIYKLMKIIINIFLCIYNSFINMYLDLR